MFDALVDGRLVELVADIAGDLMLGRFHPAVPVLPEADELPTAREVEQVRHPGWYARSWQPLAR